MHARVVVLESSHIDVRRMRAASSPPCSTTLTQTEKQYHVTREAMPQVTTYTRDKILPPERAYFDGRIALAELLQEWSKNGGLPSCAENPEPRVTSFRTIGVDVPSSNIAWEGIAIINRLFGTIDRTLKVRHGTEHYDSPNKPRLGDLVAAAGVNEIFTAMYPSAKRVNGLFQSVDFKGTIICIGDPQPNAISRTILQYKPVDYAPYSSGQLRRLQKQPLFFDLPFEPVFETVSYTHLTLPTNREV